MIKPMIFVAAIVFAICSMVKKPMVWSDYTSYLGYAVTAVTLLIALYERFLWRIIPWNRPPILKKEYAGIIKHEYKGKKGEKPIEVHIKQTWLSVNITAKTDINSSVTISASIINEYGTDILYYNYMTNPSAATQKTNPIQHGSCRMVLSGDNTRISGKYWTSSRTAGDMEWNAVESR